MKINKEAILFIFILIITIHLFSCMGSFEYPQNVFVVTSQYNTSEPAADLNFIDTADIDKTTIEIVETTQSIINEITYVPENSNTSETIEKIPEILAISINKNNKDFEKMKSFIESYADSISVFYKDLTNNETYIYNVDSQYYTASILKAPYALYLYRLALDNKIDINEKIAYKAENKRNNSIINDFEYGTEFSIEELIGYSIRLSDNTAYQMLVEKFGYAGFEKYFKDRGLILKTGMYIGLRGMTCIECVAFYLEKIYEFINEDNRYSNILKEHMINSDVKLLSFNGSAARKYGFDGIYLHEMCIVYNNNKSYLFVLLTKGHENNYIKTFGEISAVIDEYNSSKN